MRKSYKTMVIMILSCWLMTPDTVIAQDLNTSSWCSEEIDLSAKKFRAWIRSENTVSHAATDKEAEKKLIIKLEAWDANVIKHERDHKKGAGKWAGEIKYHTYVWRGIDYRIAGCHIPISGRMPLNKVIKHLLAPDDPSTPDLRNAAKFKKYIEIKMARAHCRTMKVNSNIKKKIRKKRSACLAQYKKYKWLDAYPLD